MARSIYPHKRTIGMTPDMATAVRRIARWRDCHESEVIRQACEVQFKREYDLRNVRYPRTPEQQLPGQQVMPVTDEANVLVGEDYTGGTQE